MQFPVGLNPGTDNIYVISVNFIKDTILLLVLQILGIHYYVTWPGHGYKIVTVLCNFMAGGSCSTLGIGLWTYKFIFGFRKVNSCQRSIEKHCKSLKLGKI